MLVFVFGEENALKLQTIMLLFTLMWTAGRGNSSWVQEDGCKWSLLRRQYGPLSTSSMHKPSLLAAQIAKPCLNLQAPGTLWHDLSSLLSAEGSTSRLWNPSAERWRTNTHCLVPCQAAQLLCCVTAKSWTLDKSALGTCQLFPPPNGTQHLISFGPFSDAFFPRRSKQCHWF